MARNQHARTHAITALSLTRCAACAAPGPALPPAPGELVSTQQQALLPFGCSGRLTELPPVHFENLDLSVTPYLCATSVGTVDHEVDAAGRDWTWDKLRLAEHAAFRDRYHRLAPDLRARIARDGGSTAELADVWFPTPLVADQKLPTKEEFLAMSLAEQKTIGDRYNAAIVDRARKVAAIIHQLPGNIFVYPDSLAFTGGGPLLQVEALPAALQDIGDEDGILYVGLALRASEDRPASEAWFDAGNFGGLQSLGYDGDGVTVTDILGGDGVYDARYLALASGSCDPPVGANYTCYCAASAPNVQGQWTYGNACSGGHMQHVVSVIKNTWASLSGGASRHARTVVGNAGGGACGTARLEQLVPWAVGQGATVINRSATNGVSQSRYLDYVAVTFDWPSIVAAAGNFDSTLIPPDPSVQSYLRNGLVVGAVDDHGVSSRTGMTMAGFSCWQNISAAELPHLVAPGVNISTVSDSIGNVPGVRNCSGTSFSAPQVSGAIASIQEYQPLLKYWPEALMPIMLVSAFTNAQPAGPDGQLFSLDDAVDDKDGAGLLNAFDAWVVATSKVDGGNPASVVGYDYGTVDPSSWVQYTYYPEVYNASVQSGDYLRVAVVMFNHPTCGAPATETNCTADGYPLFDLNVTNPATGDSWWSIGYGNNYKYLLIHNTLATTQTLQIRIYMAGWNGLAWDTWGLAWSSDHLF